MKRTGWVLRQVNEPESVSDHMYRMATLSFLVDPNSGLNKEKYLTKYLFNQSQWTLATIIENYAVKHRTRNKAILAPSNAQNAGFYTS